jgi:hypothetical protein
MAEIDSLIFAQRLEENRRGEDVAAFDEIESNSRF